MFPFPILTRLSLFLTSLYGFNCFCRNDITRNELYHHHIWNLTYWISLQWRHNGSDSVSNHQPHDCLLRRFFQTQIKENIKAPRHWPLCREFTRDRWFPTQMASNMKNVSIWWRYHVYVSIFGTGRKELKQSGLAIQVYGIDNYICFCNISTRLTDGTSWLRVK